MCPTQYWINVITGRIVVTSTPKEKSDNNIPEAGWWKELTEEEYDLIKKSIVYHIWQYELYEKES